MIFTGARTGFIFSYFYLLANPFRMSSPRCETRLIAILAHPINWTLSRTGKRSRLFVVNNSYSVAVYVLAHSREWNDRDCVVAAIKDVTQSRRTLVFHWIAAWYADTLVVKMFFFFFLTTSKKMFSVYLKNFEVREQKPIRSKWTESALSRTEVIEPAARRRALFQCHRASSQHAWKWSNRKFADVNGSLAVRTGTQAIKYVTATIAASGLYSRDPILLFLFDSKTVNIFLARKWILVKFSVKPWILIFSGCCFFPNSKTVDDI